MSKKPPLTIEQKAAIYDALIERFTGRANYAGMRMEYDHKLKIVRHIDQYDFILRTDGHANFEKGLRELLPITTPGA